MINLRKAQDRGHANHGWLDSHHSFSFGRYYDPKHMGVSNLRVINEDRVMPGQGFGTHGHQDMEIISYVLSGELAHKDSMGNGSTIQPGDVQRMSAGTGVTHSEYNGSDAEPVHFLQIWLQPNTMGIEPAYSQKHFPVEERRQRLVLLVSPDGRDGSIATHQDAFMFGTLLEEGESVSHSMINGKAYVHMARGSATVNGEPLTAGDAVSIEQGDRIRLVGSERAEILLFDLP